MTKKPSKIYYKKKLIASRFCKYIARLHIYKINKVLPHTFCWEYVYFLIKRLIVSTWKAQRGSPHQYKGWVGLHFTTWLASESLRDILTYSLLPPYCLFLYTLFFHSVIVNYFLFKTSSFSWSYPSSFIFSLYITILSSVLANTTSTSTCAIFHQPQHHFPIHLAVTQERPRSPTSAKGIEVVEVQSNIRNVFQRDHLSVFVFGRHTWETWRGMLRNQHKLSCLLSMPW